MSRVGVSDEVRAGGGGSAVWCGCAGLRAGFPIGGGGIVSGFGGVGGCSPLVPWRTEAVPRGLLVVPLVFSSPRAVWDRCGEGPGVPWGGVCRIGVSQPGRPGCVVTGCVDPPLSAPRGVGSAVCGPCAGPHVCWVGG